MSAQPKITADVSAARLLPPAMLFAPRYTKGSYTAKWAELLARTSERRETYWKRLTKRFPHWKALSKRFPRIGKWRTHMAPDRLTQQVELSTSTGGAQTAESRELVPRDQPFRSYIL
ncbi:hypothetical protein C8R48DRAFT_780549 [Suillus tomentosus]|nr:hypothetical protein C8R48DRAFT_780549 [Suillus tomentosus]